MEKGQLILIADLKELLAEAEAGEFGDYSNDRYASPKRELARKFDFLRNNVINGKYD